MEQWTGDEISVHGLSWISSRQGGASHQSCSVWALPATGACCVGAASHGSSLCWLRKGEELVGDLTICDFR
jgi:hypothetical protein